MQKQTQRTWFEGKYLFSDYITHLILFFHSMLDRRSRGIDWGSTFRRKRKRGGAKRCHDEANWATGLGLKLLQSKPKNIYGSAAACWIPWRIWTLSCIWLAGQKLAGECLHHLKMSESGSPSTPHMLSQIIYVIYVCVYIIIYIELCRCKKESQQEWALESLNAQCRLVWLTAHISQRWILSNLLQKSCRLAQTHYADLSKVFFFRPRCQNACGRRCFDSNRVLAMRWLAIVARWGLRNMPNFKQGIWASGSARATLREKRLSKQGQERMRRCCRGDNVGKHL